MSKFAIIQEGGKQYTVEENTTVKLEKIPGAKGDSVQFTNILMFSDGKTPIIGHPTIKDVLVTGEIVGQSRNDKIIVFKKKRRQNYRRKNGHRQLQTIVKITGITQG